MRMGQIFTEMLEFIPEKYLIQPGPQSVVFDVSTDIQFFILFSFLLIKYSTKKTYILHFLFLSIFFGYNRIANEENV